MAFAIEILARRLALLLPQLLPPRSSSQLDQSEE